MNLDVVDVNTGSKKNENTPKTQKNNNLLKTKKILNVKMSAKGGPFSTFSLPGGAVRPLAPRQLRHCI